MGKYAIHECESGEHPGALCGCGLGLGELQMRGGLLCTVDERGRLYLRAPRQADRRMAQRVVATMRGATDDVSKQLVANLKGIREK